MMHRPGNGGLGNSARYASGVSRALIFVSAMVLGGGAWGATAEGTLITNVASASYGSVRSAGYAVSFYTTAWVLVANPAIAVQKVASPTVVCSGAQVTFCIWTVNTSAMASAFDVVLTDKMPDIFSYVAGQNVWVTGTTGATVVPGYYDESCFPHCPRWGSEPANGQAGPYYVRWVISVMGPGKSAMACFKALVL